MDDSAISVTTLTDQFYQLVKIDGKTHAPPICFFCWGSDFPGQRSYASLGVGTGSQQRHGFKCVVESVRQRFTLFSPQGVPLRATLTVSLKEYKTLAEQLADINNRARITPKRMSGRPAKRSAKLPTDVYEDPSQWRAIADQNTILDPLDLKAGTVLEIPVLTA